MDRQIGRDGALERALELLGCFTADEPVLSAASIAQRTGIAISSVYRLLAKLTAAGLADRVDPHRYSVGLKLWKLGELNPVMLALRETALPQMLRLYDATGENVQLAVLDAQAPNVARALYIARIVGTSSSATLTRVGGDFPLHTTGVGKALLAAQSDDWIAAYISEGLLRETRFSITDGRELVRDLEGARARGYATTHEEMTLGTASVAVALDQVANLPAAAIGVVTDVKRFRERELGAMVQAAANQLHGLLHHG